LTLDEDPHLVAAYFVSRGETCEHPDTIQGFMAYDAEGQALGATAFHHFNTRSVTVDICLSTGFFPKMLLFLTLWYGFEQLKCSRLTFYVSQTNLKSINLVEKLGAYRGATLIDGCREGDVYIYYLLPDRCRIWSKFYGKRRRLSATSTRSV
jgi:RimJ/RimL family protein N-acetyltransferase